MATGGAYSLDLLPIRPADKVGGFLPVLPLDHACRSGHLCWFAVEMHAGGQRLDTWSVQCMHACAEGAS
jgi:hypothetical protein